MPNTGTQAPLERANLLACIVVGGLHELYLAADHYAKVTNPARKKELAEQFLDHLYELFDAWQSLYMRETRTLLPQMAAYADGLCRVGQDSYASAHQAVLLFGHSLVTQCVDVMLRRQFPGKWPPQQEGGYTMPDKLPHRQLASPHAAAVIENFWENLEKHNGPLWFSEDQLNGLSPRLEQEYARACLRSEAKGETAAAAPKSRAWCHNTPPSIRAPGGSSFDCGPITGNQKELENALDMRWPTVQGKQDSAFYVVQIKKGQYAVYFQHQGQLADASRRLEDFRTRSNRQ